MTVSTRRSPLTSRNPLSDATFHGIEMPGSNHLELIDGARIASVLSYRGREDAVTSLLASMAPHVPRRVGPGEWLLVSTESDPPAMIDGALVVDQSHGRTVFRLSGPDSVALLMKGVGVDIAGGGFAVGMSASMAFQHFSVNLARIADTVFEIVVARSFAESLFGDLRRAGREFTLSFAVAEL